MTIIDDRIETTELRTLQSLKVKGFADAGAVADCTGMEEATVAELLAELERVGRVKMLSGRVSGARLTADGNARREELLAASGARQSPELAEAYDAFIDCNEAFKSIATRWQLSARDEAAVAKARDELEVVHADALDVVAQAEQADLRFGRYRERLDDAFARFRAGETDALARPMARSYHDVWMEIHEDLLSTLGRVRSDADGN
jgi:hypothetical protein